MKKIYHGSKDIIEKPIFGLGKNIMTMVWVFIAQIVWN